MTRRLLYLVAALLILLTGCGRDDLGALLVRWPF
jgi:hypothetical protein